jgi:hypothetical protein
MMGEMNRLMLALGLAGMGCEAKQTLPTSSPGESVERAPGEVQLSEPSGTAAATEANTAADPEYYTVEELRGLGLVLTSAADGETLVCGSEADSQCLCLMPLDCASGGCIQLSENVAAFKTALTHPAPGAKVQCDKAAIGDCGAFRYFDFQGDLYRREVRWFDASGALVGQRDVTDYAAHCGKQTRVRFIGRVPKCEAAMARELLCGEAPQTLSPLDDVRRYTAPRARPTGAPRQ